jgi:hypothetical protein
LVAGKRPTQSEITAALIETYRLAEYRVFRADGPFVLRVGVHSPKLASLLSESESASAAFITAWNPFSRPAEADANEKTLASLREELVASGCPVLNGFGEDPSGRYAGEPSFLAIGINLECAAALGTKYRQNALLWSGLDAVPRLILLR